MVDDIVTRLRNFHDQRDSWQTLTEAANEIERLRMEIVRWKHTALRACDPTNKMSATEITQWVNDVYEAVR